MDKNAMPRMQTLWIKSLNLAGQRGTAEVEIESVDGQNEARAVNVDASSQMYKNVQKMLQKLMDKANPGYKATDIEVRIAMLKTMFPDPSIQWLYGQHKLTEADIAYAPELKETAKLLSKTMHGDAF